MTNSELIVLGGGLLGKMKIPQATPVLTKKKRGTRCTNRRKARK
jgi:hypothetical protein